MERLGIVVGRKENEGSAIIQFRRHSMCGKCGQCFGPNEEQLEVKNPIGAKEGDWVLVTTGEKNIFALAFGLYGVPLITFVGGFALGYFLWSEMVGAILALTFTGLFFLWLRLKEKRIKDKEEFMPRIKRMAIAREIDEWQKSSC